MTNALRLYGVVAAEGAHRPLVPNTALVTFRDLAAVVSESPYARPALADGDVAAYRSVVESVFAQRAVLPAPPGVVFRAREPLERWLELHFVTLTDALSFVDGRAAARVHVARRPERISATLPAVPAAERTEEVAIDVDSVAAESFRVLRRHAAASVALKPTTVDAAGAGATASFLVERDRWRNFEEAVAEEARRDPELSFRLTGPWPPYDFVRMQFGA